MAQTILVDMDNTLVDFNQAGLDYIKNVLGVETDLEHESHREYNFLKNVFPSLDDEEITQLFEDMFNHPGFWMSEKPFPGAIETMRALYIKYDVYIVTKPWKTAPNCIPEKLRWIQHYLPFFDLDHVIFCSHKELLHGDYIIEDSPKYIENTRCSNTIVFDFPYNREVDATYRVSNWHDIWCLLIK